ncbi:MAG: hypothetical protein LBU38_06450 [Propionibacteriaceae bacterium]|jgi:hypothetical protein|nr:hypothetical protein [Propionibacteriaceae bacterium]
MMARTDHELADAQVFTGARVAWTYLGALAAAVVGAVFALILAQFVPQLSCSRFAADSIDAVLSCELSVDIALFGVCFILGFAALVKPLKLGWWVLAPFFAGVFAWLWIGRLDAWWWWVLPVLLPALAALASARWFSGRGELIQRCVLVFGTLIAVLGFGVSIVSG